MALNGLGLGFVISATDIASPTFRKVSGNMTSLDRTATRAMHSVAAGSASAAAGLGVLRVSLAGFAGINDLTKAAGDFEVGMAQVAAISNIAVDSLDAQMLSAVALGAAMKTQFNPKEATEGLAQFAGAGFNAQQQADSLVPSLRLAQAGMISVEESSRSMTAAMKVFGIETGRAEEVTDKLLKIANLTDLQASDLALALGTVGRGASAAKQGLDETLIAMGLVKNTGVQASVAASSVSSALIFMGQNADKFKKIGVDVTTADGKFRNFIDVVMDTHTALGDVSNEAERVAIANELFGKFGLTAFQAVSTQITNGVQDMNGQILKGGDAVKYLRAQMADSAGTAAVFEEKILGTFEGQKKLLKGMGEGLKVALGQPFIQLMKPLIKMILPLAESFVNWVNSLPPKFKTTLAGITVALLGLIGAGGTLLTIVGALKFAAPLLAGSLAPLAGIALGITAAVLGTIAVFKLFKLAADRDIGGIGKFFTDLWAKIKLFARAVGQLLTKGFVEGDVLEQLLTDEMAGLRKFLGTVVRVWTRIQAFFFGLRDGFVAVIIAAAPVWKAFKESLVEVGDALSLVFGKLSDGTKGPVAGFTEAGVKIGKILGRVVTFVVDSVGAMLRVWAGFIRGVVGAVDFFKPVFELLITAFGEVVEAIRGLLIELGLAGEEGTMNTEIWGQLGEVLGWVVTTAIQPLVLGLTGLAKVAAFVFRTIGKVISWVKGVFTSFREEYQQLQDIEDRMLARLATFSKAFKKIWQGIVDFVVGIFDELKAALNSAIDFIADIAARIPARFRPQFLDDFIASRQEGDQGGVLAAKVIATARNASAPPLPTDEGRVVAGKAIEQKATGEARAARTQSAGFRGIMAGVARMLEQKKAAEAAGGPAIKLFIDGRELAARVEKAAGRASALAFSEG